MITVLWYIVRGEGLGEGVHLGLRQDGRAMQFVGG